uniref:RING-type E3 ubiquitin transferase n=1 Tax=Electrophorus electricus TaxID=8005 RepID=A0A4W4FM73_ELEEL
MFESEDSDIEEGPDVIRHKTKIIYQNTFPYIHMEPPDALYERWIKIKPEVKKAVGHMLHISVFWWHILFRQQENHTTTAWAVDTGFLDSNVSNDLSLKRLHRIEILELILNTMEKCRDLLHHCYYSSPFSVSLSLYLQQEDCLAHAVSYLEESGPPGLSRKLLDLGRKELRYQILRFIFTEYARYVQVMSCSKTNMIRELTVDPELWCLQKSEEMKNKGNEQFQKKKYDLAVKWYTKAIKHHTSNHFLYGNRALAFIRCEKYLKAMGDGKRAIILQQDWAKGHYRFCDALFFLGAKEKAVEANLAAQSICSADPEGMRDLQQQYHRFMAEVFECKRKCSADTFAGQLNWIHKRTSVLLCSFHCSEMAARRTKKAALCVPEKQSVKNKHPPAQEKVCSAEQFCAAVLDAHTALYDQRCRNAQQAFSLALSILDSTGTKALGISELDRALLIYGYATAMIEIGQPEELGEAQRQFEKLSFSEDRKFQSLVLYGMGKVFLKENRFSKALEKFSNALLMVQRQITCGKLTWPTTKVTVEETRPEYLKKLLESSVEMCKFPPKPDAICRHQYCLGHTVQIYFTDPDFKGFIRMSCCQRCKVEFHISCWKKFKTSEFSDKNDKDFLQDSCFTPDCMGRICHIVIFGSTGLIKCEVGFRVKSSGSKFTVAPCPLPPCSLKKSKEDGLKLRRKQQRAPATLNEDETITIEEEANNKEAAKESPKDYTVHGDRVLHQIYESRELFKDELHSISSMLVCLRPWMELDEGKSHASVLKGRSEPQALWELVDVLLERRNRVWARVFIQILSGCQNIKPKLHDWAQQLDSVGLKAAESFIGHCGDQLEELDLSSLLAFPPLQDVLIEKFGTMPELFDNTGFTIIEYLKQAPPQEMRLFIWTLEENRERYPTCFTILDEYFEMDAICLVIKKTGIDNVSSLNKAKSKNRKKKQKEPKSVIFMSGMRSDFVRDEEDEDIFAEEDSFMLLDGNDPFSVPDHLRDQVAEFEGQYVSSGHLNYYKKFLDNNPDPTKESLYDYFEQILEEHGPLETSDPLLVGELENFPAEAQQKISAAGGLEPFLCESLRFYMMDNLIGLMGHAVSLQVPSHLNPTAKEFLPQFEHLNVSDSNMSYDNDILDDEDIPILAHSDPQNSPPGPSALSNPCVFGSHITANIDYVHVSQDMDMAETAQTELQEDYHQKVEITNKELSLFQQKLEEEIRKDQQEKRDNQEALKALKVENKELLDLQERLSKQIQDKNMEYQAELDCFLEISNQCEAEKMSLEEEIKRCRDRCAKAANRSQSAQVTAYFLSTPLQRCSMLIRIGLDVCVCVCVCVCAQYEEQMELVSTGNRLESLPLISVPSAPAPPPVPVSIHTVDIVTVETKPCSCNTFYISKFIQEVRSASVSRFNMLTYEDMINRVAQLILDHQEDASQMSTRNSAAPSPAPSPDSCRTAATPPPTHVWKNVSIQQRNTSKALNMEDPCIICHEEMAPEDVCVLECRHSFHRECIRSWLKEQSTCPTCREHALLPEDFPMLPGRHRRGHAPAASFS